LNIEGVRGSPKGAAVDTCPAQAGRRALPLSLPLPLPLPLPLSLPMPVAKDFEVHRQRITRQRHSGGNR